MKLVDMSDRLQSLAHQGYAIADIEVHSVCENCDTDVILTEPQVTFLIDEKNHKIRIKFEDMHR